MVIAEGATVTSWRGRSALAIAIYARPTAALAPTLSHLFGDGVVTTWWDDRAGSQARLAAPEHHSALHKAAGPATDAWKDTCRSSLPVTLPTEALGHLV